MHKCLFDFVNNTAEYHVIKKCDFLFSNKKYGENCISLNRCVDLFDCFFYFYKNVLEFDTYIYVSKKAKFLDENLFVDEKFYIQKMIAVLYISSCESNEGTLWKPILYHQCKSRLHNIAAEQT